MRARSTARHSTSTIISFNYPAVRSFNWMNRTAYTAETSPYRVRSYLYFPIDGIPIGSHKSLWTRSSGFQAPRVSLSAGFRRFLVDVFSKHDSHADGTGAIRCSIPFTRGAIRGRAAYEAWPKRLLQFGSLTSAWDLPTTSAFGFRTI